MKNYFENNIIEFREILNHQEVFRYIKNTLNSIFKIFPNVDNNESLNLIVNAIKSNDYENQLNEILPKLGIVECYENELQNRAQKHFDIIKNHIKGQYFLDFGCGDGELGKLIANVGFKVGLADIYKHKNIDKGIRFYDLKKDQEINQIFDNTALLTVLHHSSDPIKTLQKAKSFLKNGANMIIIETVYGINNNSDFGKLNDRQQFLITSFIDHFCNRAAWYNSDPSKRINVPFNYNTPNGWKEIFQQQGLKEKYYEVLGKEQILFPGYHVLYVLENK
ncbi:class I SAM-dependent methyltransferase [Nanoarchaeota archaeon]